MEIIQANESHREYVTNIIKNRWQVSEEEANYEFGRWILNHLDSVCFVGVIDSIPMATGAFDTFKDVVGLNISPYNTLLWVEPEYRGNGYGEMLSNIRYEWALEHNYKVIHLDTINALDYHKKFGWTPIKSLTHNNENYIIMQKILDKKLTFEQTRNIFEYSEILKPLAEDFTTVFYQSVLIWCGIIPSDNAQNDLLWDFWLIKLGNKPIGVCGLYALNGVNTTTELWLGWLGIIPELRNLNLGSQIMQHLYDYAKSVGCERIFSYVDKDGKPLSFYKKEGFSVIGTVGEYCEKHCLGNIDGDDFEDKDDFVIIKEL